MQEPINLQELDLIQLKALVYDFLAAKEDLERSETFQKQREILNSIQVVNNEISIRIRTEMDKPNYAENHIRASNHNSLLNPVEDNKLVT